MINQKQRNELGIKIRKCREKKKLTQAQLASKLGQPYALIGRIERGQFIDCNRNMMDKLLEILDISM